MADWPGAARRHPSRLSSTYAVRAPLARWLREEAARAAGRSGVVRVLDVGCGVKPYYPWFEPVASTYVGVDVVPNPAADLLGPVEALPVADASFDLVLCNQVLEHCDDPAQAVRELRRVLAPGGRVLASTHGVQVYHPSPNDFWRWTHAGLERLFRENAEWDAVRVQPGSGTTACLAMLTAHYIELLFGRAHLRAAAKPLVGLLNAGAEALDARAPSLLEPQPGTLFANFHVTAEAPG
ncbi:MAG TPA: class I SAM-dependent methyltransferase [Gaiellaceae bacterium]|jgi:SAM-dependent methyltransferase|nr:class I SAM-dependent methyltransferase [Gaiellaceae bacterium]